MRTDSRLSFEERQDLLIQATEMYLKNGDRREIKTESYEGLLYTSFQYDILGCFGGQRFDAELETHHGKVNLRFLVNEQTYTEVSEYVH